MLTSLGPPPQANRSRRSRPRRLVAALAATAMVLAGAACSSDESSEPTGPVALRVTTWSGNENHKALFKEIADAYVAANPDKVSSVTFDSITTDYFPTITTQIAGGKAPDLIWVVMVGK